MRSWPPRGAPTSSSGEAPVIDKVETYVAALFTVFIILIFVRILLSFIPVAPASRAARAFWDFVHQSTDWYLNIFRRMIPPLGMFDLSPIIAIIVLYIVRGFLLSVLGSF